MNTVTLVLSVDEQTTLMEALNNQVKSAQRAQKTTKTPQIRTVYEQHEKFLNKLITKVSEASEKITPQK